MKPEEILAKHGLSRTSIRTKLIQILAEAHEALSSKEIEQQLDDNVDRVTIYRTIKLFEDKGLIHKIVVDEQSTKYRLIKENRSPDHPHFHCVKCDKVVCLPDTPLPCCDLPQGFRVSTQNTIIEGTCQKCNN